MTGATTFLEVATLGRFEIRRHHDPLTGGNWNRRKVCDLFKLLLSAEQHRLHREQIQEILWPESTSEQAANSFGKTLYLLRRALEPDLAAGKGSASVYVLLDHDTLMLIPDSMKIDADLFESSAKQLQVKMRSPSGRGGDGQMAIRSMPDVPLVGARSGHDSFLDEFDRVLAFYVGDYLPEDLYEDWTQRRRDRLRRIHSWLLENAAELALANSQGRRACEYLQNLLERNSADEQTHRQLMLVYARMGRRSDALNQYQLLREALREELHANPLPETVELFRTIQSGRIAVDLGESRRGNESVGARFIAPTNVTTSTNGSHIHTHLEADKHDVGASLAVAQLEAEPSSQGQIDPDRILKAELVGREEEIRRLQRAYKQIRNGQRRVVFMCGEPGIGKTRLAREFTRWGEETQQATVLWGYCYEMGGLLPYQPIADAISAHVRTCSPEQLRSMLGNSAVDLAKIAPELRLKLPELPQPEPLGPEAERRNLYNAVARYFMALSAERPLIIILDDLQWADAATLHLLSFLTLQSAGVSPFDSINSGGISERKPQSCPLYLMLYRAGEVSETHPLRGLVASLARGGIGEELRLQRLTEEQVQQLLVNMARQTVQPDFAGEIYRQTEGNPFFIGEAISSLIFEGKLKWTGERWQATVKLSELEIPQNVRLLIERRLVHLSPECRTTLSLAAVLGREFSSALLCQARKLSEEIVAEHIDDAIQAQLIYPPSDVSSPVGARLYDRGEESQLMRITEASQGNEEKERNELSEALYRGQELDLAFTHDKIREVLYQWLNPLRRRTLHRQVSQAIEAHYATRLQPYYSTLAYHYQIAEDPARAVDYLLKAAKHAESVYAFTDATRYIETARDLLISDEDRPLRATLLRQLGDIYLIVGRPGDAIKADQASCTLWRDLGDAVKEAEAYLHMAFCCHWMGRMSVAVEHIKHALKCIETQPEEICLFANAYAQWGLSATVMGDVPTVRDKLQLADELHQKIGDSDPFISVVSIWSRSWCAYLSESPRQMLEHALRGAEVCVTSRKPEWEPMMNYSAAWSYMLLGQLKEGEQLARDALKKAQQHGVVGAQSWANLVLAFLAIQAGRWEEAEQFGNNAYAIAAMLHDADLQARVLWSHSVCSGWQGEWQRAIDDITKAMQMAQQDGETSMIFPHLLVQAAKAYFFAGKPEEAQRYLDQGMQFARSRQYRQLPAIGQRLQGRIWQAQGKFEQAQPCFEQSLAELSAIEDIVEHARTQEAYGLFFLERNEEGDEERGQELLKSARETFERLGVNG